MRSTYIVFPLIQNHRLRGSLREENRQFLKKFDHCALLQRKLKGFSCENVVDFTSGAIQYGVPIKVSRLQCSSLFLALTPKSANLTPPWKIKSAIIKKLKIRFITCHERVKNYTLSHCLSKT